MVQAICRIAKMTSLFAGIVTSLFLMGIALPCRWIIFQFIVFVILKLCFIKKNVDAGAADADYGHLLEAWYDDLYPSSHTASVSDSSLPYEPVPPEIVKEVLLEEGEGGEEDEEKDVHEVITASVDETWMTIMEGHRGGAKRTSGTTSERYWRKVEDVETATSTGARRELVGVSETTYKKKDQVDVKARWQQKKNEEGPAVWRRPKEVLAISHDELSQRVEAFIRMQRDHLRLQRRESERRRLLEKLEQSS